jgi:asparagine synthase (glutamine-hydrolysing)
MCSIAGIFGRGEQEVVVRMNEAQRHRGPDDQGVVQCGNVVLGNTRLAIIDTSTDARSGDRELDHVQRRDLQL